MQRLVRERVRRCVIYYYKASPMTWRWGGCGCVWADVAIACVCVCTHVVIGSEKNEKMINCAACRKQMVLK